LWQSNEAFTEKVPQSTPHLVPSHGIADRPSDREPDPGRLIDIGSASQVQNETRPSGAVSASNSRGELIPQPHPMIWWQHGAGR
jgi:hypothetical protein